MTLTVSRQLEEKLVAVAGQRDPQTVLDDMIAASVAREERIVASIRKGIASAERGEFMPHEQVMAGVDAIIAEAEARLKAENP